MYIVSARENEKSHNKVEVKSRVTVCHLTLEERGDKMPHDGIQISLLLTDD